MYQEPAPAPAQLQAYVDRTLVPAGRLTQRFALLMLRAPEAGDGAQHPPLNLSLVIDRSGSMSGDKLEFVKDAARHAVRLLNESDRVSIILYDDEVEVLAPSRPVTRVVRNELLRRLREIHSGASTDLHGGWDAGCAQVRAHQGREYVNRVLLLTDGLANAGVTDHEEVVKRVKAQRRAGLGTTTFGVGTDFNQFLLQGMADNGGGHFYYIENPAQIAAYFKNELGEMLTVTARNMTIEIETPEGVTLDLLNDLPHETTDGVLRLDLGDVCSEEERSLALRLGLPALEAGMEMSLPVRLRYSGLDGQSRAVDGALFFLTASAGACEEQPVNETALAEAGRLLAARAKMQALAFLYRNELEAARGALQETITLIQKMLPPALAVMLVHELEEMIEQTVDTQMSVMESKQRHYAAYRTQRTRNV